ncbi:DMT family transporter [Rhabdaerophilum sp.]|uniref:DMT family transporter n=1 Tax=Rhabdaerophilum sp. TaxID=2717341 RepID=UPI0038D36766
MSESTVFRGSRRALRIGTGLALISAALYGANVAAARVASQAGMPGADLIAWRSVWFLPLLAIIAFFARERLRLLPGEAGPTLRLSISASLTAIFYLSSVDHLPVPMAVVLFYMFPLFVILLASRIEGRRISRVQMGVFVVAFAGLVTAVGPSLAGLSLKGVLFTLGGAFACAYLFITASHVPNAPLRNAFWTQVFMGPLAFLFAWLQGGLANPAVALGIAPVAVALAMGAYALAYWLQLVAAQKISADRAGLLFLFEPVMAIAMAGLFLGEVLTPVQSIGVALILAALAAEIRLGTREP